MSCHDLRCESTQLQFYSALIHSILFYVSYSSFLFCSSVLNSVVFQMSSCEPQVAMTQLLEIMDTTRKYMDEGDLPVAYELVTEAAQLVVQMEVPSYPWCGVVWCGVLSCVVLCRVRLGCIVLWCDVMWYILYLLPYCFSAVLGSAVPCHATCLANDTCSSHLVSYLQSALPDIREGHQGEGHDVRPCDGDLSSCRYCTVLYVLCVRDLTFIWDELTKPHFSFKVYNFLLLRSQLKRNTIFLYFKMTHENNINCSTIFKHTSSYLYTAVLLWPRQQCDMMGSLLQPHSLLKPPILIPYLDVW